MRGLAPDPELEARVRATLHAVAEKTASAEGCRLPVADSRRRSTTRGLAAVAAAVLLLAGLTAIVRRDGADGVQIPAASASGLPTGFDMATATPIFAAPGEVDDVVRAYLRSRFPDYPAPGITTGPAAVDGERATATWATGGGTEGELARGKVHLRRSGDWWAVVGAETAGVDLSTLSYDGTRVQGTITSTNGNSLFADALDWRGEPVHRSPERDGHQGAAYRVGTAGGPATGALHIDIPHPGAPVIVRVNLVGGTVLSVSEVRFDPPLPAAHRDYEGCVRANTTKEKEPLPDVVARQCAASLDGTVIATGAAGERVWELIATDEANGSWVTLRSRDQVGSFRIEVGDDLRDQEPQRAPFTQVGACCALGKFVAVAGTLHPDAAALRVRTSNGQVFEMPAARDPASRASYAVVLVPMTPSPGTAVIEVILADGSVVPVPGTTSLAVLGG